MKENTLRELKGNLASMCGGKICMGLIELEVNMNIIELNDYGYML